MIEPTSADIGRTVYYHNPAKVYVKGTLTGINQHAGFVEAKIGSDLHSYSYPRTSLYWSPPIPPSGAADGNHSTQTKEPTQHG